MSFIFLESVHIFFSAAGACSKRARKEILCSDAFRSTTIFFPRILNCTFFFHSLWHAWFYAIRFAMMLLFVSLQFAKKHCRNGTTAKTIYDSGRIFYRCTYYIGSLPPTLPSSALAAAVVVVVGGPFAPVPLELPLGPFFASLFAFLFLP